MAVSYKQNIHGVNKQLRSLCHKLQDGFMVEEKNLLCTM